MGEEVSRYGDRVVAGAKLTLSSQQQGRRLPMEVEGFRVSAILPADYGPAPYAEIGRLVVDPDYRGKEVLARMIDAIRSFTLRSGGGYLFVQAPSLNAVLYRQVCRGLSMRVVIHKGLSMACKELYSHLQLQLLSCDIRSDSELLLDAVG